MGNASMKKNYLPTLFLLALFMGLIVLILFSTTFADETAGFLQACSDLPHFQLVILSLLLVPAVLFGVIYRYYIKERKKQNELAQIVSKIEHNANIVINEDDKIVHCEGAVDRIFGYNPEELLTHSIKKVIPSLPGKRQSKLTLFDKNSGGTYLLGLTVEGKRKDGSTLSLEINTGEIKNSLNKMLLIRDITKLRKAETEIKTLNQDIEKRVSARTIDLQEAYSELRGVDKMRDSLLSSVSGELRRPLTSIRASAETLLNSDEKFSPMQRDLISVIFNQSEGLITFINEVLHNDDQNGPTNWLPKRLEVKEVLKRCLDAKAGDLNKRGLKMKMDIAQNLPNFIADEDRIHQVFTSLLSNAIKFTSPGGAISIKSRYLVKKRSEDNSDYLYFAFKDTGVGIAADQLPDIFNRYSPGRENECKSIQRIRQGLSICKDIVTCHGGRIWIDSTVGKGTTVHVTIPVSSPMHAFQEQHSLEQWNTSRLLCN